MLEQDLVGAASTENCEAGVAIGDGLAIVENHPITIELYYIAIVEIGLDL